MLARIFALCAVLLAALGCTAASPELNQMTTLNPFANTSITLTRTSDTGTVYPARGAAQTFSARFNSPPAGTYTVELLALTRDDGLLVGTDVEELISKSPAAAQTMTVTGNPRSQTVNFTHTPTAGEHVRYFVIADYVSPGGESTSGAPELISNLIDLWPDLRLIGAVVHASPQFTNRPGSPTTLSIVTVPANAPNLTWVVDRALADGTPRTINGVTYTRTAPGSEQFRARIAQGGPGAGGPVTTVAITAYWPGVTIESHDNALYTNQRTFSLMRTVGVPNNVATFQFHETQDVNDLTPDDYGPSNAVPIRNLVKATPGTWYFSGTMTIVAGTPAERAEFRTTNRIVVTWRNLGQPAPTAVAGDGQVTLTWPAVTDATGYRLRWGTSVAIALRGAAALNQPVAVTSPHTITGLTNGVEYEFHVFARRVTTGAGAYTTVSPAGRVRATPVATAAPVVPTLTAPAVFLFGNAGAVGSSQLRASQSSGSPTLTYSIVTGSPSWLSISGSTLNYTLPTPTTWQPNPDPATGRRFQVYSGRYRVSSNTPGVAPVTGSITIEVREPPAAAQPLVAADVTLTVVEGGTVSGTMGFVNNQDGAGAPHTWTIASPPTWLSTTTASAEFTARNAPITGQPHRLTYTVADADNNVSDPANIVINVTPAPTGFAIAGPTEVKGVAGNLVPGNLIWTTENAVGAVTWTLPRNLPAGVILTRRVVGGITQYQAGGRFQAAVTDVTTRFSARDSASPTPQTDDHDCTWTVTQRPTRGETTTPTVFIDMSANTPVREETIDGVRHYWFHYGTSPRLIVRAENMDISSLGGVALSYGPVYSMTCVGGRLSEYRYLGNGITGPTQNPSAEIEWESEPINAVIGIQSRNQSSSFYLAFSSGYGQLNRIPVSNFVVRRDDLIATPAPNGRRFPGRVAGNVPDTIVTTATYDAKLRDHRDPLTSPFVPIYRTPIVMTPENRGTYVNARPFEYRVYGQQERTVATDQVVCHWIPAPLTLPAIPDLTLPIGGTSPNMPEATGGVPPYRYALHGTLPPGMSVAGDTADSHGNRMPVNSPAPPVVVGAVSAGAFGRWPLTLVVTDGAEWVGHRQSAVQQFAWSVD